MTETVPPALFEHVSTIYSAMKETANEESDQGHAIWTGFATHLFEEKGLSIPYYTQVMRMLQAMDCLRQLRRGGGSAPSKWLLVQEPTLEQFDKACAIPGAYRGSKSAQTDQMLRDLSNRIGELEDKVEALVAPLGE